MAESDPITKVFDGLWAMLEGDSRFTALVPSNNRIKYNTREGDKLEVSTADFPDTRIRYLGGTPHTERTSNSSTLFLVWSVEVATGDQRYATIFPIEWAVYCALLGWGTHLRTLTYGGVAGFVKNAYYTGTTTAAIDNNQLNRGTKGWSSVWQGEVQMWFATALIAPETT